MTCKVISKAALSIIALAGVSFSVSSCTTAETASADGPQVIGVAKQAKPKREWGGAAEFFQSGMALEDEPDAISIDPLVDYVDYHEGLVRYGAGSTETFAAPQTEEEEVEFRKIGFD